MIRWVILLIAVAAENLENLKDPNREIERLIQVVKREENSASYLFKLAQNYQKTKQPEKAIEFYRKRLEKEGDPEESWFSKYMIGECYEQLEKWDEALYWYLEAFQTDPSRAEPLLNISTHYRLHARNDLAYIFAKFGSLIPPYKNPVYFSTHPLENYQFDEELSIVSYYTQFKEDGFSAANNLLLKRNVPQWIRDQTYRNLLYYIEPLKNAHYQSIDIDLPYIRDGIRLNPMNPSILKTPDGFSVICRAVNYTQTGAKHFQTYDENGIYRSRNYLLQYDPEFCLFSQKEIIEELPRERIGSPIVQGLEDCRLFAFDGGTWFTCTTTDTNPTGSYQISLCKLGEGQDFLPVESLVPLQGPDPYRCEKNWLPFVQDGNFYTVYSYDPFIIYAPDPETGDCECVHRYEPEKDLSPFRGSGGPIPFDDGYLILVHEVTYHLDWERVYLHRFLFLNKDFVVIKTSKPFIFKHKGVEYCCSMTLDHTGTKLIMPIGIEDREAHLCIIDCNTVRSLLL
jgi:tetratricopeptide (TPR) repeat protein